MTTLTDLITPVAEAAERIDNGLLIMRQHIDKPKVYANARARLMRIVKDAYLPGLERLRTASQTDLHQAQTTLAQRLDNGFEVIGFTQHGTEEQFERWTDLLYQYVAVTDAIEQRTINTVLDRLALLPKPPHMQTEVSATVDTHWPMTVQ